MSPRAEAPNQGQGIRRRGLLACLALALCMASLAFLSFACSKTKSSAPTFADYWPTVPLTYTPVCFVSATPCTSTPTNTHTPTDTPTVTETFTPTATATNTP